LALATGLKKMLARRAKNIPACVFYAIQNTKSRRDRLNFFNIQSESDGPRWHLPCLQREGANSMKASTRGSSPRAAIILAGGEGLRMRSVTRFITGQEDLPKQFCPMMDGMTWFENTRNRVAQLIPVERSFIVVKQSHRHLYAPLLGDLPRSQIIAQPSASCARSSAPSTRWTRIPRSPCCSASSPTRP
jgi:hypothetical protein